MVRTFPSILGLSPEKNIEPKLTWLRENLGLTEELVLVLVKVWRGYGVVRCLYYFFSCLAGRVARG